MTVTANIHCNLAGWSNATYTVGARRSNAGNAYQCITAGTSTSPPTGTGSDIVTTGTAHWKFLSVIDYGSADSSALQTWADALPTTLTQPMIGQLWNNAAPAVLATAGTPILTLTGHTTSPTNTITLRAATGEGWRDTFIAAPTTPYTYNRANGVAIEMPATGFGGTNYTQTDDNNVIFDGLQLCDLNGSSGATIFGSFTGSATTIQNCIIKGTSQPGGATIIGLPGDNIKFLNCLIIDLDTGQTDPTAYLTGSSIVVVNCTFVSSSTGNKTALASGNNSGTGIAIARNSIFINYPFCYGATSPNGQWAVDHCAHTAASFDVSGSWAASNGSANLFGIVPSAVFVNSASDFHLKAPSSVCINAGVTDTTDIPSAVDTFGTARPQGAAWDIGPHEVVLTTNIFRDFPFAAEIKAARVGDILAPLENRGPVSSDMGLNADWASQIALDALLQFHSLSQLPSFPDQNPFTTQFTQQFGQPLGALSLDPPMVIEYLASVLKGEPQPIEWPVALINTVLDTPMPMEWRASIVQDWVQPLEFSEGRATDTPLSVEVLAGRVADSPAPFTASSGIAADMTALANYNSDIVLNVVFPTDFAADTGISVSSEWPIEWGGQTTIVADTPMSFDYTSLTSVDVALRFGWGNEGASADTPGALEWGTAVQADTNIPPEMLANAVGETPSPGEFVASYAIDMPVAIEYGMNVVTDTPALITAGMGQSADTVAPLDNAGAVTGGANPDTLMALEWRATLTQDDAPAQFEWSLSVSYDTASPAEWGGDLTGQSGFPLAWTGDTVATGTNTPMSLEILSTTTSFVHLDVGVDLGRRAIGAATEPDEWEAEH